MGVDIDEPRCERQPAEVDLPGAPAGPAPHGADPPAFDGNIADTGAVPVPSKMVALRRTRSAARGEPDGGRPGAQARAAAEEVRKSRREGMPKSRVPAPSGTRRRTPSLFVRHETDPAHSPRGVSGRPAARLPRPRHQPRRPGGAGTSSPPRISGRSSARTSCGVTGTAAATPGLRGDVYRGRRPDDPGWRRRGARGDPRHFEQLFAARTDSIFATNTDTESLDIAGDRAYEAGTITFTVGPAGARPRNTAEVRYITFWQRTPDGQWLIRRSLR